MNATMTKDFVKVNGEWLGIMDEAAIYPEDKCLGYFDGELADGSFLTVAESEENGKIVAVYQTTSNLKFAVIEEV